MKTEYISTVVLNEVKDFGVQVVRYSKVDNDHFVREPHRDEDYLFVFVRKGYLHLSVDFKKVAITENSIYFILPGQIHQYLDSDLDIIVIAIDSTLVRDVFKPILDDHCYMQRPLGISGLKAEIIDKCSVLLSDFVKEPQMNNYRLYVKQGLIDAIIGIITEEYSEISIFKNSKDSRSTYITREFKKLLFLKYKMWKKPSSYADALHISTPYLNEAVKITSGATVTYWIQYMIIIEAKRLLYYTNNSIKQIASELGYEDHTYFTKIFSKNEKISPKAFREKYR